MPVVDAEADLAHRRAVGAERLAATLEVPERERPGRFVPERDVFDGVDGLPEVDFGGLDAERLASGLLHHGGLVVRHLFTADQVERLRSHLGAGAGAAMDPAAVVDLLSVYEESHLLPVLGDYLGERPVTLLSRTKLKRNVRSMGLPWHQDAPFHDMGECAAVNLWTALTPVGERCPGLSLVPQRLPEVLAPEHEVYDGQDPRISGPVAEFEDRGLVASPVLEPGDAIAFDEMTLHRTQKHGWQDESREVAITWFFAPSRFPEGKDPIGVGEGATAGR